MVFSHGWPLSADAWEDQMAFLGARGYRCIAHDRRGHGRSSQPWNGNDMDYAEGSRFDQTEWSRQATKLLNTIQDVYLYPEVTVA